MQINHLEEYTCLLREGKGLTYNNNINDGWYWTDGNDVDDHCFWHDSHGNTLTFFAPTVGCNCVESVCRNGGDALLINIGGDKHFRGNYCDEPTNKIHRFICEADIVSSNVSLNS